MSQKFFGECLKFYEKYQYNHATVYGEVFLSLFEQQL